MIYRYNISHFEQKNVIILTLIAQMSKNFSLRTKSKRFFFKKWKQIFHFIGQKSKLAIKIESENIIGNLEEDIILYC
jgi:hypothetical protein